MALDSTHLFVLQLVRWMGGVNLVLYLGSHKAKFKVSARPGSHLEALGMNPLATLQADDRVQSLQL